MTIPVGTRLGRYEIRSQLGEGGMGEVYLVWDTQLDRKVALKVLPVDVASNQRMRRFVQEAKAASVLSHPNIAHVYEIGEANGISFIAIEYLEGQALSARITGRPLDPAEIVNIGIQVADALEEAHTKGITHRDIKPSNIIISTRNQVKVLDFGLAKVARPKEQVLASEIATQVKTSPGMVMGTVHYMSPEQALGREVDHRTDIFSLGVVLYEMATGRLPFSGATATEILDQIMHAQPEAIGRFSYNAPAELERIIRKCLEKERERRYQAAGELLVDLSNLQRDSRASAGTMLARKREQRVTKVINSLTVLPFVNTSADPDAEYLSDGITQTLINTLSQLPRLRVMARSTVFHYKGQGVDPTSVGRELNVRAVLAGRVAQVKDRLVVGVELVDVTDGSQIWGKQYNRKLSDIFIVQDEIARGIAEQLRPRLSQEKQTKLTKHNTENVEAYRHYLMGRSYWGNWTQEGFAKSIRHYNQAITIDPGYALAYSGLADTYTLLGIRSIPCPKEAFAVARVAATKAVGLDDALAEAHTSLGAVNLYEWKWTEAEKEAARSIELNPNSVGAQLLDSLYLGVMGRHADAVARSKAAQALDPLSPVVNANVGWALYFARQYELAIKEFRTVLGLRDPAFGLAHLNISAGFRQMGMLEEAITQAERAREIVGNSQWVMAFLGHLYGLQGRREEARRIVDTLLQRSTPDGSSLDPYLIALIYSGMGETDDVFEWLRRACEYGSSELIWLKVEPGWDSLRSDVRFTDLLRRMGLPA